MGLLGPRPGPGCLDQAGKPGWEQHQASELLVPGAIAQQIHLAQCHPAASWAEIGRFRPFGGFYLTLLFFFSRC